MHLVKQAPQAADHGSDSGGTDAPGPGTPSVSTRRRFLVGSGAGAAGLAVGAAGGALALHEGEALRRATAEQRFEAAGRAHAGELVARFGTRRVVWNTTVAEPLAAI